MLPATHCAAAQTTQTLTILGGSGTAGSVAANVEYYNPTTGHWQPAYLAQFYNGAGFGSPISGHPWGNVPGTNRWINYRTDGHSDPAASGSNPMWYRYRVRFNVPTDAAQAQMTFSLKADNRANVLINGVSTGATIVGSADQLIVDAGFSQNVHPGENTIILDIGDEGGLNGFNFRIDLAVQSSQPLAIVPPGTPTTTVSQPAISGPGNITVNATSAAGATVNFTASATSNVSMEVFRRSTGMGEAWDSYTTTFTSSRTGNFTLGFNVVSASGGDNSIFIDDVRVASGASTLLADGFEPPAQGNTTRNVSTPATLGSNWYFNNYGGIIRPPTGSAPWGTIANGTPPEGSQFAVIRDVASAQSRMRSVSQVSLVAGQVYTVAFKQASRELVGLGGVLTYTVTLDSVESVPVVATPLASGATFPIGTTPELLTAVNSAAGVSTASFNVTVRKLPVTFTPADLSQTYDGTTKSITVTSTPANVAYVVNYSGARINAGNYSFQVLSANPIYEGSATGVLEIGQATATITVNGFTGTYDGAAHGATGTATGVGGVDLGAGLNLGATFTNAPGGTANWTFAGGTNYHDANGTAEIVITKATATVSVNGYTGVYDGVAHGATGTATGVGGADLGAGLSLGSSFTNVPGGTASWTFAGGTNYHDANGTANIAIAKANPAVVVTPYSVTYNAAAHSATVASITGVNGETGAIVGTATLNTTHTNAGIYADSWSLTGGANYNDIASTPVTNTIAKAPSATVVTISGAPFTYNGAAHTPATVSVTGAGNLSLAPPASYANNTDAGTATASYTYGGDANHHGSSDTRNFTIDKASSTTVVTINGGPFTYNGAAHTPATVSVTGAGNLSLAPTANYANNTNAGTATASYAYAGDANHTASNDSKNFTIAQAPTKTTLSVVPAVQALLQPVTLTATVVSVAPGGGVPVNTVTFTNGATVLGTATLNASGVATLTTTALPIGPQSITAIYGGSPNFIGSVSGAASVLIYGYPAGGGTFVIGDGNATVGTAVNFWGSQWEKKNSLSGGASNASFKGFAVSMAGATFTAAPGNSAPSPASVPTYLGVIVTSKVTKSGSNITGTIVRLVVVKTNPGYAGDPGSPGTGTIVAVIP